MLTITPAAASAVTALLDHPDLPDSAGLRLQRGTDSQGETALGVVIVTEAEPQDEHVPASEDREIFLAPDVAGLLSNQVLDADMRDDGVAFTLRPQPVDGNQSL